MKKYFTLLMLLFFNYYFSYAQQYTIVPQQFSTGYTAPIMAVENCGDNRIFVVQQSGQIFICDMAGNKLSKPFLDLSAKVTYNGKGGLLGLAFDPHYSVNHYFYVDYFNLAGHLIISRFRASYSSPNNAIPGSEYLLQFLYEPYINSQGGYMHFGPDGFLYIGTGDGGDGNDPYHSAQDPYSLLGKILRIDPRKPSGDLTYTIPPNNPFVDSSNYTKEIWALGLQSPRHFSWDSVTGAMIIADGGLHYWQELNYQQRGVGGTNYGWSCYEGGYPYNTAGCNPKSFYKLPLYQYSGASAGGCSIIGGYVYQGTKYSYMKGKYFFTDYCNGVIKAFLLKNGSIISTENSYQGPRETYWCFGEDSKHELYLGTYNGTIYHLTAQPVNSETVTKADTFTFNVTPNPSHGSFVVNYKSEKTQLVIIHIQNMIGQQFYASKTSLNAGNNNLNLIVRIPHGDYIITITDASGKTTNQRLRIE